MKCPVQRILWYWLPAVAWLFAVRVAHILLYLIGKPPSWAAGSDKLMHFLYFGIMGILFWRALRFERRLGPWAAALAAFAIVAVYGGVDEFIQQFRPYRSADIRDWFADAAGGALPLLITSVETLARPRRARTPATPCPESVSP